MFALRTLLPLLLAVLVAAGANAQQASNGLSLIGTLKYPPGFKHFDYVNPDAPKGGTVKFNAIGTFDTLNPFTVKGDAAAGIDATFDTLLTPAPDEPASAYGLLAESVSVAPDKLSVLYVIRKEARFHDGTPVTPDDVIWTFNTLKTKGKPIYRLYYADVVSAEKEGDRGVRFRFRNAENRELPEIVGEMRVLSKAYYAGRDFEKTTLDAPMGSGPYVVASVDPGRSITYRLAPDYWGKDLPVNVGRHNFGEIRYDYYRDAGVALEAFKAGQYDVRVENVAKNWAIGYDGPALSQGLIRKEQIPNKVPQGMQAFVFNTRPGRPFTDPRVREAISGLFDFEWANKNLFFDAYTHTDSYFSNSELASSGLPTGAELALLQKVKSEVPPGTIPDRVFTTPYAPPKTDGTGNIRPNLVKALKFLEAAGYTYKNGALVDQQGKQLSFEILLNQPEFDRVVLPFQQNLARAGIKMSVRDIDPAQYINRMRDFDFDMTVAGWGESISPGNEQRSFWSSAAADEPDSDNTAGIKNKAVDALVDLVIGAPDRQSLVVATHALDRVLLAGFYAIPNWYLSYFRVASWDKFGEPAHPPLYGLDLDSWWVDSAHASATEAKKQPAQPH